jgi:hypothetical protein
MANRLKKGRSTKRREQTGRGKLPHKCVIRKTKKYRNRSSPPYPANKCPGVKKMGNDGRYYKSVADVNGIYKWTRVAQRVV